MFRTLIVKDYCNKHHTLMWLKNSLCCYFVVYPVKWKITKSVISMNKHSFPPKLVAAVSPEVFNLIGPEPTMKETITTTAQFINGQQECLYSSAVAVQTLLCEFDRRCHIPNMKQLPNVECILCSPPFSLLNCYIKVSSCKPSSTLSSCVDMK